MGAVKAGVVIAAVLAGPPLYGLVQAGSLNSTQAWERGAVVAVGAAFGAGYIERLIDSYRRSGPVPRPPPDPRPGPEDRPPGAPPPS